MSPEKTIRKQAQKTLSHNNWSGVVAATILVCVAVMMAIFLSSGIDLGVSYLYELFMKYTMKVEDYEASAVLSVTLLPIILLISPLAVGFLRYIYLMMKHGETTFNEIFHYMSSIYLKTIGVSLMFVLRNLWKFIVCFIPYFFCYGAFMVANAEKINKLENLDFSGILWYVISYALLYIGALVCMRLCANQFLYFFIYFENDKLTSKELSLISNMYMQRFRSDVSKLFFSLLPWMLTCVLVIPVIFVLPYVTAVLSTSAKWILALQDNLGNKDE